MKNLFFAFLLLSLWSCSEKITGGEQKEPAKTEVVAIPAFDASSLQKALDIQPSTTVIASNQVNTIGNGDLQMVVPAFAFVDEEGNYPEKVKLTHYIADDIFSMVASDLSTLDQNGKALSSNGMFFLNATTEDGKQLAISNESGISVRVGLKSGNEGFKVYGGTEKEGKIVWKEEGTPSEPILAFEASDIYPDHYWLNIPKAYKTTLNNPKFDNTNMATLAVRNRLRWSEDCSNYLNWLTEDYNLNDPPADIMNIYIENCDQPIWISDSLVAVHIQNAMKTCKESGRDCPHEKDMNSFIELYKSFAEQRLGNPFDFGPYQEALTSGNPIEALVNQGISKARSNYILSLYQRKEELSSALDENNKIKNKVNSYQLNRLGWSNIDKLFRLGKTYYPKVVAQIQGYDAAMTYKAYLLVPRYRVLVNLSEVDGTIKLNENGEQYGLSIFDDCLMVVLGIKGEAFSLGKTKFRASKDQDIDIQLEGTTIEEFESLLKELN